MVTALGADVPDAAGENERFAGDLTLLRLAGNDHADAIWRGICLGEVRVTTLASLDPDAVASALSGAGDR